MMDYMTYLETSINDGQALVIDRLCDKAVFLVENKGIYGLCEKCGGGIVCCSKLDDTFLIACNNNGCPHYEHVFIGLFG